MRAARIVRGNLATLVFCITLGHGVVGCGGDTGSGDDGADTSPTDVLPDTPDLDDTADTGEPDAPDGADVDGVADTHDASGDANDAVDASDANDAVDTNDASDAVDTNDAGDAADANDAGDDVSADADDAGADADDADGADATLTCGPGAYRDGDGCVPLTVCAPGTRVLVPATETSDRVCRACPSYMHCPGGTAPGEVCRYRDQPAGDPTLGCAPTQVLAAVGFSSTSSALGFPDGGRLSFDFDVDYLVAKGGPMVSLRLRNLPPFMDVCSLPSGGGLLECRLWSLTVLWDRPPGVLSLGAWSSGLTLCGIKGDQTVDCRHKTSCAGSPLCVTPTDLPPAARVAVGQDVACIVSTGGAVRCWGSNPPTFEGTGWVDVQAAEPGVCAIDATGHALCKTTSGDATFEGVARVLWYQSSLGVLHQDGTLSWMPSPPEVPGLPDEVVDAAANGAGVCWLDRDHETACYESVVGNWRAPLAQEPRLIAVGQGFINAWGDRGSMLGVGFNVTGEATPPSITEPIARLVSGTQRTCAITTSGALHCWGIIDPPPADLGPVSGVALGNWTWCALKTDGTVRCWGQPDPTLNTSQLGLVSALDGLGTAMCFALKAGGVKCLGMTQAPELGPVRAVGVGFSHACALGEDGVVTCWGDNGQGQSTVPADLGPADAIAVGAQHTCARRIDQTLVCWGDRSGSSAKVPEGLGPVQTFDAGVNTTCAVDILGEGVCWGFPISASTRALLYSNR